MKTKRERFQKVASYRVNKTLDFLRLIGNCSNRNNYEYTQEEVDAMFETIENAVKEAREAYNVVPRTRKAPFTFGADK